MNRKAWNKVIRKFSAFCERTSFYFFCSHLHYDIYSLNETNFKLYYFSMRILTYNKIHFHKKTEKNINFIVS